MKVQIGYNEQSQSYESQSWQKLAWLYKSYKVDQTFLSLSTNKSKFTFQTDSI